MTAGSDVAPAWQSFPLMGGKGLWLCLLARKRRGSSYSCLLELWLLPSVQGGDVAQGFTCVWPILPGQDLPPATALAVSSLHPCVTDLWRDLILMGLVLTHTT